MDESIPEIINSFLKILSMIGTTGISGETVVRQGCTCEGSWFLCLEKMANLSWHFWTIIINACGLMTHPLATDMSSAVLQSDGQVSLATTNQPGVPKSIRVCWGFAKGRSTRPGLTMLRVSEIDCYSKGSLYGGVSVHESPSITRYVRQCFLFQN